MTWTEGERPDTGDFTAALKVLRFLQSQTLNQRERVRESFTEQRASIDAQIEEAGLRDRTEVRWAVGEYFVSRTEKTEKTYRARFDSLSEAILLVALELDDEGAWEDSQT